MEAQISEAIRIDNIAGGGRFDALVIKRKSWSEAGQFALVQTCIGNGLANLLGSAGDTDR
jgi:hypothetical protein